MDQEQLKLAKRKIRELSRRWRGKRVKDLSFACGYVRSAECRNSSFHRIGVIADHRMYEAKSLYYRAKGIDRRGQQDAHTTLIAMYSLILKLNMTEDTYKVVDVNENACKNFCGITDRISECLSNFAENGRIHPDDVAEFSEKTNADYIRSYFKEHCEPLTISYRRETDGGYRTTVMEFVPAADYTHENQTLYMYVK